MAARIEEAIHFAGPVTMGSTFTPPALSIKNAAIASDAGIENGKQWSIDNVQVKQGYPATTIVDEDQLIFVAPAEGNLRRLSLALVTACIGDSTVACTLEKNGVTVTNSLITFDNSIAGGDFEVAPLAAAVPFVAGDKFELVINATVGTGTLGKGLHGWVVFDVSPQS